MYNLLLSMIFNGEIRIIEKEKEIQQMENKQQGGRLKSTI